MSTQSVPPDSRTLAAMSLSARSRLKVPSRPTKKLRGSFWSEVTDGAATARSEEVGAVTWRSKECRTIVGKGAAWNAIRYCVVGRPARPAIRLRGVNVRTASDSATPAVDAQSVTRRFGRRWALRGVSLRVETGEIVGVEGQNGSGKSTLLRVLSTALRPTAGRALVFGADVVRAPDVVRGSIAFLAHFPGLYDDLTAEENLRFAARMLGVELSGIPALLERVGLEREAGEPVRSFSAGMQRRLSLARLLLQRPRLLLLDEPYNNFDPQGIALVNSVVGDVRESGGAAMIVLHDRHSAGSLLDRVIRLRQGLLESDLPPDDERPAPEPASRLAASLAEGAIG